MMGAVSCLTNEEAVRLIEGELDSDELSFADEHVDGCARCKDLIGTLAASPGALVAAVSGPVEENAGKKAHPSDVSQRTGHAEVVSSPGRLLAMRYEIRGCLGMGAMGVVYTCHDRVLQRTVALKVLKLSPELHHEAIEREAQAMAQVHHANVVSVYDVGEDGGEVFIVMEQVTGVSLRAYCLGNATTEDRLRVLVQCARGLSAAHAAGIVHRDVKPDNIFVADGTAKIGDFGLARADFASIDDGAEESSGVLRTNSGIRIGTPAYMAPELFQGAAANAVSDTFAFAVTAWEALFHERPFRGRTVSELRASLASGPLAPREDIIKRHRALHDVLARALSPNANERSSLASLLAALERASHPTSSKRRNWFLAGGTLSIALAVFAWGREPTVDPCANSGNSFDTALQGAVDATSRARLKALGAEPTLLSLTEVASRGRAAREHVCRASKSTGTQSDALLDARMQCIDRTETAVRIIATATQTLEAKDLGGFAQAVADLPDPKTCVSLLSLAERVPPPVGKERATAALNQELEAAWVSAQLAGTPPAPARVSDWQARAKATGHAPTLARAFYVEGQALRMGALYERADESVLQAITHAESGHDDQAAADAWLLRVAIAGDRRDLSRAELWLPLARAAVVRAGNPPQLAAKVANSAGLLALNKGDLPGAARELERALALRVEFSRGELDVEVARTRSALGHVARLRGDLEEAQKAHTEGLRVDRILLGPKHPDVGRDLHNLAGVLRLRGAHEDAASLYLEALQIRMAAYGAEHPEVALTENSLGLLDLERGRFEPARERFERALAVLAAANHEDAALPHENLVRALVGLNDPKGAIEHAKLASTIELRQRPTHNPRLASMLEVAAAAAEMLHDRKQASAFRESALKVLGDDDPELRKRIEASEGSARQPNSRQARPRPPPNVPSTTPSAEPRRESYGSTQSWN